MERWQIAQKSWGIWSWTRKVALNHSTDCVPELLSSVCLISKLGFFFHKTSQQSCQQVADYHDICLCYVFLCYATYYEFVNVTVPCLEHIESFFLRHICSFLTSGCIGVLYFFFPLLVRTNICSATHMQIATVRNGGTTSSSLKSMLKVVNCRSIVGQAIPLESRWSVGRHTT